MRRDMELFRKVLLAYEDEEPIDLAAVPQEAFWHHVILLRDAGFLVPFDSDDERKWKPQIIEPYGEMATRLRLSSAGADFLDATSSPTVVESAKRRAGSLWGSLALPVLMDLLKDEARKAVGLLTESIV